MSDGITEARRGTYFLDRSKLAHAEVERTEIENSEKAERIRVVESIQEEPDMEKAQKILQDFKDGISLPPIIRN